MGNFVEAKRQKLAQLQQACRQLSAEIEAEERSCQHRRLKTPMIMLPAFFCRILKTQ